MLVAVHNFGSIWSARTADPAKARAGLAYFNTTGVLVGNRYRHRSCIYGHVRVDSCTGFRPDIATRFLNRVFECDDLQEVGHVRKLFMKTVVAATCAPDLYLLRIDSDLLGTISRHRRWASPDIRVVSFSEGNGKQEALLIAPSFAWICGARRSVCVNPILRELRRCTLAVIEENEKDALHQG